MEVLRTLLPKFATDKLSDELELPNNGGDFNMTTLLDTALGTLAAKPLEIAMGVYDPLTLRTQITMDSSEVCTDLVLAMFECYKHVTNVVQVAAALSVQVLNSSGTTMVKSTTTSGASTWEVRSTIAVGFGWLEGACGLTLMQLKTRGVMESKFSELRFRIELLDDANEHITSAVVLIDDISDLARLDRGVDFEISKEWISLSNLGESAVTSVQAKKG